MVLSDRTIRRELDEGRIVVDPIDFDDIQPASIDLHLDNRFLVFSNSRRPYIDVRESQADLTEEVKIQGDEQFILHPGEFVLGQHSGTHRAARRPGGPPGGQEQPRTHRPAYPQHCRLRGSRLERPPDAGTQQRGPPAHRPVSRHENRADSFLRLTEPAERLYGSPELGSKYQGQSGPTASRFHQDFAD